MDIVDKLNLSVFISLALSVVFLILLIILIFKDSETWTVITDLVLFLITILIYPCFLVFVVNPMLHLDISFKDNYNHKYEFKNVTNLISDDEKYSFIDNNNQKHVYLVPGHVDSKLNKDR